jgi:hypothetical protein
VEDFGTHGHLFDIKAISFMSEIMGQLLEAEKSVQEKQFNDDAGVAFVSKVWSSVRFPVTVAGLSSRRSQPKGQAGGRPKSLLYTHVP